MTPFVDFDKRLIIFYVSLIYKLDFTSVALWTNGEVQPVVTSSAVVLDKQLVKILTSLFTDI